MKRFLFRRNKDKDKDKTKDGDKEQQAQPPLNDQQQQLNEANSMNDDDSAKEDASPERHRFQPKWAAPGALPIPPSPVRKPPSRAKMNVRNPSGLGQVSGALSQCIPTEDQEKLCGLWEKASENDNPKDKSAITDAIEFAKCVIDLSKAHPPGAVLGLIDSAAVCTLGSHVIINLLTPFSPENVTEIETISIMLMHILDNTGLKGPFIPISATKLPSVIGAFLRDLLTGKVKYTNPSPPITVNEDAGKGFRECEPGKSGLLPLAYLLGMLSRHPSVTRELLDADALHGVYVASVTMCGDAALSRIRQVLCDIAMPNIVAYSKGADAVNYLVKKETVQRVIDAAKKFEGWKCVSIAAFCHWLGTWIKGSLGANDLLVNEFSRIKGCMIFQEAITAIERIITSRNDNDGNSGAEKDETESSGSECVEDIVNAMVQLINCGGRLKIPDEWPYNERILEQHKKQSKSGAPEGQQTTPVISNAEPFWAMQMSLVGSKWEGAQLCLVDGIRRVLCANPLNPLVLDEYRTVGSLLSKLNSFSIPVCQAIADMIRTAAKMNGWVIYDDLRPLASVLAPERDLCSNKRTIIIRLIAQLADVNKAYRTIFSEIGVFYGLIALFNSCSSAIHTAEEAEVNLAFAILECFGSLVNACSQNIRLLFEDASFFKNVARCIGSGKLRRAALGLWLQILLQDYERTKEDFTEFASAVTVPLSEEDVVCRIDILDMLKRFVAAPPLPAACSSSKNYNRDVFRECGGFDIAVTSLFTIKPLGTSSPPAVVIETVNLFEAVVSLFIVAMYHYEENRKYFANMITFSAIETTIIRAEFLNYNCAQRILDCLVNLATETCDITASLLPESGLQSDIAGRIAGEDGTTVSMAAVTAASVEGAKEIRSIHSATSEGIVEIINPEALVIAITQLVNVKTGSIALYFLARLKSLVNTVTNKDVIKDSGILSSILDLLLPPEEEAPGAANVAPIASSGVTLHVPIPTTNSTSDTGSKPAAIAKDEMELIRMELIKIVKDIGMSGMSPCELTKLLRLVRGEDDRHGRGGLNETMLGVFWEICLGSEHVIPAIVFDLNPTGSAYLQISIDKNWPSQSGFCFSIWVCVDSFGGKDGETGSSGDEEERCVDLIGFQMHDTKNRGAFSLTPDGHFRMRIGEKAPVKIKLPALRMERWYHFVYMQGRSMLRSATATLFVNGAQAWSERAPSLSGISAPVIATIGTDSATQHKAGCGVRWRAGPIYLFDRLLTPANVMGLYLLGNTFSKSTAISTNHYHTYTATTADTIALASKSGLWDGHTPPSNLVSTGAPAALDIPESQVIFCLAAENESTYSNGRETLLANSAAILGADQASAIVGGACRTTTPCPVSRCIERIGGVSALLPIVQRAATPQALLYGLDTLASLIRSNPRNYAEMARVRGYRILAALLHAKATLLDARHANALFRMVGFDPTNPSAVGRVIANKRAFSSLFLDIGVWKATENVELMTTVYTTVKSLITSANFSFNIAQLRSLNFVSVVLRRLRDEPLPQPVYTLLLEIVEIICVKLMNNDDLKHLVDFAANLVLSPPSLTILSTSAGSTTTTSSSSSSSSIAPAATAGARCRSPSPFPSFSDSQRHQLCGMNTEGTGTGSGGSSGSTSTSGRTTAQRMTPYEMDLCCAALKVVHNVLVSGEKALGKRLSKLLHVPWIFLFLGRRMSAEVVSLALLILAAQYNHSGSRFAENFKRNGGFMFLERLLEPFYGKSCVYYSLLVFMLGLDPARVPKEPKFESEDLFMTFSRESGIRLAVPEIMPIILDLFRRTHGATARHNAHMSRRNRRSKRDHKSTHGGSNATGSSPSGGGGSGPNSPGIAVVSPSKLTQTRFMSMSASTLPTFDLNSGAPAQKVSGLGMRKASRLSESVMSASMTTLPEARASTANELVAIQMTLSKFLMHLTTFCPGFQGIFTSPEMMPAAVAVMFPKEGVARVSTFEAALCDTMASTYRIIIEGIKTDISAQSKGFASLEAALLDAVPPDVSDADLFLYQSAVLGDLIDDIESIFPGRQNQDRFVVFIGRFCILLATKMLSGVFAHSALQQKKVFNFMCHILNRLEVCSSKTQQGGSTGGGGSAIAIGGSGDNTEGEAAVFAAANSTIIYMLRNNSAEGAAATEVVKYALDKFVNNAALFLCEANGDAKFIKALVWRLYGMVLHEDQDLRRSAENALKLVMTLRSEQNSIPIFQRFSEDNSAEFGLIFQMNYAKFEEWARANKASIDSELEPFARVAGEWDDAADKALADTTKHIATRRVAAQKELDSRKKRVARKTKTYVTEATEWTRTMRAAHLQSHRSWHYNEQDRREYDVSLWNKMILSLITRPGGVWEEASYRELPKWKLDFTEGPMRMRCRLERDYLFYKRYPPAFMQMGGGGFGACGRGHTPTLQQQIAEERQKARRISVSAKERFPTSQDSKLWYSKFAMIAGDTSMFLAITPSGAIVLGSGPSSAPTQVPAPQLSASTSALPPAAGAPPAQQPVVGFPRRNRSCAIVSDEGRAGRRGAKPPLPNFVMPHASQPPLPNFAPQPSPPQPQLPQPKPSTSQPIDNQGLSSAGRRRSRSPLVRPRRVLEDCGTKISEEVPIADTEIILSSSSSSDSSSDSSDDDDDENNDWDEETVTETANSGSDISDVETDMEEDDEDGENNSEGEENDDDEGDYEDDTNEDDDDDDAEKDADKEFSKDDIEVDIEQRLRDWGYENEGRELRPEHKLQRFLEPNDEIQHVFCCEIAEAMDARPGMLLLCKANVYVIEGFTINGEAGEVVDATASGPTGFDLHDSHSCHKWSNDAILEVVPRRYLLRWVALEVFTADGRNILLVFDKKDVEKVKQLLCAVSSQAPFFKVTSTGCYSVGDATNANGTGNGDDLEGSDGTEAAGGHRGSADNLSVSLPHPSHQQVASTAAFSFSRRGDLDAVTRVWVEGEMSNFQYLMYLNTVAGRSYNDLSQYPVFPWVIADYTSETLDLNDPKTFRDLSKPMGALTPARAKIFKKRYDDCKGTCEQYHYSHHYSSSAVVGYFLLRLEPFTKPFLDLNGGHWDCPERLFHQVHETWNMLTVGTIPQVMELTPEFYCLPDFLVNSDKFLFGCRAADRVDVDSVLLPPWAHDSPREFVRRNLEALESPYVSAHLHEWIDLIFGYKQRGEEAVKAINLFFPESYEGAVDIDSITDEVERRSKVDMIRNFGQTPRQLWASTPHPARVKEATEIPPPPFWSVANKSVASAHILTPDQYPSSATFAPPRKPDTIPSALSSTEAVMSIKTVPGESAPSKRVLVGGPKQLVVITDRPFQGQPQGQAQQYKICYGYPDYSIRVWSGGKQIAAFNSGHDGPIAVACASYGGEALVTGGKDCVVKLFTRSPKKSDYRHTADLCGHLAPVTAVAVSRDQNIVVSGDANGLTVVWDLNKHTYIRRLSIPKVNDSINHIAIHDITGYIATCSKRGIYLWSINGELLAQRHAPSVIGDEITSCTFSREWIPNRGQVLVTGHVLGSANVWDTENFAEAGLSQAKTLTLKNTFKISKFPVTALHIPVSNKNSLYAGDSKGNIYQIVNSAALTHKKKMK